VRARGARESARYEDARSRSIYRGLSSRVLFSCLFSGLDISGGNGCRDRSAAAEISLPVDVNRCRCSGGFIESTEIARWRRSSLNLPAFASGISGELCGKMCRDRSDEAECSQPRLSSSRVRFRIGRLGTALVLVLGSEQKCPFLRRAALFILRNYPFG